MKKFLFILLWIWQLPQNIVGFILSRFRKSIIYITFNDGTMGRIYFTSNVFGCGVSLGEYILMDYKSYWDYRFTDGTVETYNHEHGHQKQSRYLGIFYLLFIGIPSACGNLIDRIVHKKHKNGCWYYKQPWEKWADRLGQVDRKN